MLEENLKLFRKASFIMGAAKKSDFPNTNFPEVAFIGRSNVGKSSLINAITDNKKLARVSKTPGRTRQVNFFTLEAAAMIVDLPGYGYAKASKTDVKEWTSCMVDYLRERKQLRRLFLLIDSRIGIKKIDVEFIEFMEGFGTVCQIVLTKCDKTPLSKRKEVISDLHDLIKNKAILMQSVIISSSKDKLVTDTMRGILSVL